MTDKGQQNLSTKGTNRGRGAGNSWEKEPALRYVLCIASGTAVKQSAAPCSCPKEHVEDISHPLRVFSPVGKGLLWLTHVLRCVLSMVERVCLGSDVKG